MIEHTHHKLLLAQRAVDVELRDEAMGFSALVAACASKRSNRTQVIRHLINAGADCNATDLDGNTPLVWACAKGSWRNVGVLLVAGADKTARNAQGFTAADICALCGRKALAETLVNSQPRGPLPPDISAAIKQELVCG